MRNHLLLSILVLGACGPLESGEVMDSDLTSGITKVEAEMPALNFDNDVRVLPRAPASILSRRVGRGNRPPPDAGLPSVDANVPPPPTPDAGTDPAVEADAGTTPPVEVDAGAEPPAPVDAGTAAPGYDPQFRMGNCNEWWIEVYADAQSVAYEREDGSLHALAPQSWGSFAVSEYLQSGTRIRLHATRDDGAQGLSGFFAFLVEQPVLAGTPPPVTSSYDPQFRMATGANEWWVEVYADAGAQSVRYEREDGSLHALPAQSWGSFAVSEYLQSGTRIRLHATRDDGAQGRSGFFAYLLEQPLLEGTSPPEPEFPPATTTEGVFQVSGRFLYDPCGNKVILRGVNKMNIWTDPTGSRSFAQIARTGANVVRIVWDTTGTAAALDVVIANAIANKLLPMVELHDATGNWSMLQTLVNYWVRADVLAVVKRHESALLVNIGNEVGNGTVTAEQFRSGYTLAITRMRQAGIQAPLVIDSTQWGYNVDMIQANGAYLTAQDPLRNLIFSTHAYWSGWTAARIEAEIKESADIGLPMIIGEFAAAGFTCALDTDYQAIMASSQAHETGWIAWSWGPGNTPCGVMDMTTDNSYESLHDWGLVAAVTGAASIQNTAQPITFMQTLSCN